MCTILTFVKWGTYRTHSQVVHRASKKWKQDASTALVALDHLWWRMRNHLDGYLEAAEREVRSVQASFMALSNYENCQADLEGLLKSYASSMSTMKKSHRKLEHTWREVSNLLGELSSVLRDGDVFGVFVQAEGCASPLAKQTLQQARVHCEARCRMNISCFTRNRTTNIQEMILYSI